MIAKATRKYERRGVIALGIEGEGCRVEDRGERGFDLPTVSGVRQEDKAIEAT